MQFASLAALALALSPAFALPISSESTASSTLPVNSTATYESNLGSYTDVEFPFTQNAIISAVKLSEDVAPIVLDDAVYFVNTTIASQDMAASLAKRDAGLFTPAPCPSGLGMHKRQAGAWKLPTPMSCFKPLG